MLDKTPINNVEMKLIEQHDNEIRLKLFDSALNNRTQEYISSILNEVYDDFRTRFERWEREVSKGG